MKKSMIDTCLNCSDFDKCKEPCDHIESLLEKLPEWSHERAISQIAKGKTNNAEVHTNESNIDNFRSIDPAAAYQNEVDTDIDWDIIPPQPVGAHIEKTDRQLIDDAIRIAIRKKNLKFRRRFRSFLRCETMVRIASRSATTKQNIQKQFQMIINKVHQKLAKRDRTVKSTLTPYKFKLKLS